MSKKLEWDTPSEKDIENAVLYYLNYRPGVFAFKVNTMGVFDAKIGVYRKPSKFVLPGTPDILACVNVDGVGIFVGFEVKAPNGRQSPPQKDFQNRLKDRANGYYFVIKSIKDVEDAITLVRLNPKSSQ